jgi:hypothetical protein
MLAIPDLVRDAKLDTRFDDGFTKHVYFESGLERKTRREEHWKRRNPIGRGSYGRVWLEQCVVGRRDVEFRAVKEIPKLQQSSKPIDYTREIEAIAKFSHRRVWSHVLVSEPSRNTQFSDTFTVRPLLCQVIWMV